MMKKTWSLLLATAMVAGMLTGCGGQKSNGGSEAGCNRTGCSGGTDHRREYKLQERNPNRYTG